MEYQHLVNQHQAIIGNLSERGEGGEGVRIRTRLQNSSSERV